MSKVINEELAAIEAAAVAYLTAFNSADITGVVATYTDDGVLMGPGLPAAVGKTELDVVYRRVFEAVSFDMEYEIKEVEQVSSDWAFVRSATEGIETDKTTGAAVAAAYQELFLLCKSANGSWQIARYCTSKISP
ncbi:SgcJ/EcaC family oxidoreductase [Halomonas sp. ATBC28]|uniref:YybH family protein n=1 Tax=Halomonas sp. ATBC28 TaxID=2545264 RepID=UPI00110D4B74|nr:SgcJ/EcaC family oxidoreductase [Halomonas sp. ATBC28]TMU28557.1 SgcJ/EcaC family oxidoreductase [Halomonas sp. ATBC28]